MLSQYVKNILTALPTKIFNFIQSGFERGGSKGERGPMGPRVCAYFHRKYFVTKNHTTIYCFYQGPPGKSIRGPPGPVGPQGPPGPPGSPSVVTGSSSGLTQAKVIVGECGCNESMVESVITSLVDVLPRGDRGEVV